MYQSDPDASYVTRIDREFPLELRREFTAAYCTLNGHPAVISGARMPFAHVRRLDNMGGTVEFSWYAVQHVLRDSGGRFHD